MIMMIVVINEIIKSKYLMDIMVMSSWYCDVADDVVDWRDDKNNEKDSCFVFMLCLLFKIFATDLIKDCILLAAEKETKAIKFKVNYLLI